MDNIALFNEFISENVYKEDERFFVREEEFNNYLKRFNKNVYKFIKDLLNSEKSEEISNVYLFKLNVSWSRPSFEAVSNIKEFVDKEFVIEVGAGTGLWSILMTASGINVLPTDFNMENYSNDRKLIAMKIGTFEENQDWFPFFNVMFMSWPSNDKNWAYEDLLQFRGNKLIYFGEEMGGACANDSFFEELEKNWESVADFEEEGVFGWGGNHMEFFIRKNPLENPTNIYLELSENDEFLRDVYNVNYSNILLRKRISPYQTFVRIVGTE